MMNVILTPITKPTRDVQIAAAYRLLENQTTISKARAAAKYRYMTRRSPIKMLRRGSMIRPDKISIMISAISPTQIG